MFIHNQSKSPKKKKMLTGVMLSTMLALTMTACSSKESSSTSASGSSASDSKEINIAQIGPFTGSAAAFGNWDNRGIRMAVDEVNANGGIHGKKINLIKMDDQGNPTVAVNAAQKLVNENVVAAFATPLSTTTLAVLDVFSQAKIPQFTAGQDPTLTSKGSKYIFRYNANSKAYTKTAADYIVNKLGYKKIALISNSGAYGKGEHKTMLEALDALGVKPVDEEEITPDAKDFTAQLTNIKNKKPEVLYIGAENIQGGLIVKQARALGIKAQIVGGSPFADQVFINTAGKETAEGTIFTTQFIINNSEETKAFNEAYKKKYNEEAGFHAAKANDGANMLIEAMNKAYPNLDGEHIQKALLEIKYHGLTGDYNFDETGEGTDRAQMGMIKNGKPEAIK